ncbi:predicted protein [Chaetomium globosum CBS 148.51]|uniref:Uncharacterized protein n=1 Tax=Chaetomium globosum (strain ATCC 6205 / CBS 148.51 / DSM 1962 / NBRC 6347 / NRRL 1970) TaxID=306901 RepID=Q2HE21_CHAGB|nr:uncharacterized protein CHGG_01533 [Chaetomium globosum CBS 148.51]EAQ93298.1 predicted protein [Chaetomium globosum CBS 148.51]
MAPSTQTIRTGPLKGLKAADVLTPMRICFRVRVEDVPGALPDRCVILANDFLNRNFHRDFDRERDYAHTPVNTRNEGKAWIILDVNKHVEPKPDPRTVELVTLRVKRVQGSLEYGTVHYANIRSYTSLFPWGARRIRM